MVLYIYSVNFNCILYDVFLNFFFDIYFLSLDIYFFIKNEDILDICSYS